MLQRILTRFPENCRTALRYESISNIGGGAALALFSISLVVLEDILQAELYFLGLLAAAFFGSSLISPLVPWLGRTVPMRMLVIVPTAISGLLLIGLGLKSDSAIVFTALIATVFCLKCLPRVGEMNMYRVFYPVDVRGRAVGVLRSVAGLSMLLTTLLSWWWFAISGDWYFVLFAFIGCLLLLAAWAYSQIPVAAPVYAEEEQGSPATLFVRGTQAFFADKRFLTYQTGFAIAGIANHIGLFLVPEVLADELQVGKLELSFLVTVMPALLLIMSAPFWGKWSDGKTPMIARGLFNVLQMVAYVCYAVGGLTGSIVWFYLGTVTHATSNGGGLINWLTGSMYFATPDKVSLYNTIHVGLTGVRGLIGPVVGYFLFIESQVVGDTTLTGCGWGANVWFLCAALSALGAGMMFILHRQEKGTHAEEGSVAAAE